MTFVKWNNRNIVPAFADLIDDLVTEVSAPFTGRVHQGSMTIPKINILESDADFKLEVAAPGLSKDQFALSVEEEVLTIEANTTSEETSETTESTENSDENTVTDTNAPRYTRREFNYSSFKRTFSLPENVNADAISAAYENGILVLTLPKLAKVEPKAIEIAIS